MIKQPALSRNYSN